MKISIRGPIVSSNQHRFYQWYGMEATSPKSVADALAKGNGERAEVEINSGGGEIFAASEIYTALRNYAGGVLVRIVGLAASAASIIAMAGGPEAEIAAMMDAETWITAQRAVELGLVDRVMQLDTGQKPMAADFYSGMLSEDALKRAENFLKNQAAGPDFFMPERAQAEARLKFLKL